MIREVRDEDVPAVRRLYYDSAPEFQVGTEAGIRHWLASPPERARLLALVAEDSGQIVGWSDVGLEWHTSVENAGEAWVLVHPDHRRRGIGGRLAEAADEHLRLIGARQVETFAQTPADQAFAERRGFEPDSREIFSSVDPRSVDPDELRAFEAEKVAEGFRLGALAELRDRPEEFHALDAAVTVDIPSPFPVDDLRYDEWLEGTYAAPDLDWDGSRLVFAGERPVAMALLNVDPEVRRADNDMTGTLPEFRGRGLARLAKLSVLVWAAEQGIEKVGTGNDASNAAMLAVNRRLGYRPRAEWVTLTKELR